MALHFLVMLETLNSARPECTRVPGESKSNDIAGSPQRLSSQAMPPTRLDPRACRLQGSPAELASPGKVLLMPLTNHGFAALV